MISSFVEKLVLEPNLFIMKIFLSQLYTSSPSRHFNLKTSLGLMNHETHSRSLDILIFGLWKCNR